jgi:hypothetical protein
MMAGMICPKCGSEYREGHQRCTDCDVDLIPRSSDVETAGDPRANIELVKVFEGGNPAIIPLLESLFDDAGIEYSTSSENLQDLFGWGRVGGTFNFAIGPIKFYVRREDESEALAIIDTLSATPAEALPADE